MKIGIFDSGVGGLTVYKELKKKLSGHTFLYFADLYNFPYGIKTEEEIIQYSMNIMDFFLKEKVDLVVIACNTACSIAINELRNKYDTKIYSIIEPTVSYILDNNIDNIVLLATNATVKKGLYNKYLGYRIVESIASSELVEACENYDKDKAISILDNIIDDKFSNIILACTHFPIFENEFKNKFKKLNFINPAVYLANQLKSEVYPTKIENDVFYTSKDVEHIKENLNKILGKGDYDVRLHIWDSGE